MTAGRGMKTLSADLHVHLGRASGMPVKITASASFNLGVALREAAVRKGLDVVGLVDCCAGPVLRDLSEEIAAGRLAPVDGGGLLRTVPEAGPGGTGGARELLVVTGCEVELLVAGRPVHFLAYLPGVRESALLGELLAHHVRNPDLGCQRAHGLDAVELGAAVRGLGGVFGLAHAFTPHRGMYGSTGATLADVFERPAAEVVDFVEMGLSADSKMADMLCELQSIPLIASSDAHGADAVGREVTVFRSAGMSFRELVRALTGRDGRGISATYGLDPRLGKYHRSCCTACGWSAAGPASGVGPVFGAGPPSGAVLTCPRCSSGSGFVTGVYDRVVSIADRQSCGARAAGAALRAGAPPAPSRPPYLYHLPLRFLPGIGPKTRALLLDALGSEIEVLHRASHEAVSEVVGRRTADTILSARRGELKVRAGGGGVFGKVTA